MTHPIFFKKPEENDEINEDWIDYRYWQIGSHKRSSALKFDVTISEFGVEGWQEAIRSRIALAEYFENFVKSQNVFELV